MLALLLLLVCRDVITADVRGRILQTGHRREASRFAARRSSYQWRWPHCYGGCKCTTTTTTTTTADDSLVHNLTSTSYEYNGQGASYLQNDVSHGVVVTCTGKGSPLEVLATLFSEWFLYHFRIISLTLENYTLEIAGEFFHIVRYWLQELHLRGNQISGVNRETFKGLPNLKVLSITKSSLTSFPNYPFWGTTNLKTLDLSHNQFENNSFVNSSLCVTGDSYPTLEKLNLRGCGLQRLLPNAFAGCKLTVLDLSNNNLSVVGPNQLTAFSQRFPFTNETSINLDNNSIHNVSRDSGLLRVVTSCEQSSKQHHMLLLSGNQFCCDEEVLWLRNYSSCIDTDQPCYPSTGDTRKCTLFTFQLRGLCSCNAIKSYRSSEFGSPLSILIPVIVVFLFLLGVIAIGYRRHRHKHFSFHCPLFHTGIIEDNKCLSYGSTAVSPDLSSFLIPHNELRLKERIGSGSYGTVYQAKLHGSTVAVKRLNLQDNTSIAADAVDDFIREAEVLSKLHHENIIRLLGLCTDLGHVCIVMEYVRQGSVKNLLMTRNVTITWQLKLRMLIDASNGMVYLHSRQPPVIHRDLKSSNLLVDRQWRVKLCDFGVAKLLKRFPSDLSLLSESGSPDTRAPGTLRFTAPELMSDRPKLTVKADVYSFGIVMWEFAAASIPPPPRLLGTPLVYLCPFPDLAWSCQVIGAVCQGRRPAIPANCPDFIRSLMKQCWHKRTSERPVFTDILERLQQVAVEMGLTLSSETSDSDS